ncbi:MULTISPECIES: V-type ATP synthase subunit I [Salinibaculum]|uniref:V-type ATP synthase subunit I n=1 Tax=Salinibaculum TaxID=2732368 RepID=UPI0030CD58D7
MLRPERMSRVSVTGSKGVMDDVVETVHGLRMLHVTEYDGSWEGFEPGTPEEGADEASQKLVTVRSLKSILGVTGEDVGPSNQLVTEEALEDQLEDIRQDVNELDDRRDELRDELRSVEERIDTMEPFVALGIDLDLLRGYDSLAVRVGEADATAVESALADSDIDTYDVSAADGVVAVFAYADGETLQDALVNANFTAIEVPDGDGAPKEYLEELRHRKQQLQSKLQTVEDEIEDVRLEVGGFLLAAEEELTIEVQKREAPLTFATTENAFVAEGWLPTTKVPEFESRLYDAVGDHVEIAELEQAEYDEDGHVVDREEVEPGSEPGGAPTAADGGADEAATDGGEQQARADGGTVTMGSDDPPVIQDNPGSVKPFEALVEVINRPKYSEFDPTFFVFLTFPAFFGFMIGDLGYGILYMGIGALLMSRFDNDVISSLGGVALWAGAFTAVFGVLYGEFFGLHQLGEIVFGGEPPMHKGLQPAFAKYALTWLTVSVFAGLVHLIIGYVLDFVENLEHGVVDAVTESGSWILMMVGIWAFIFSSFAASVKPAFLFASFARPDQILPGSGGMTVEEFHAAGNAAASVYPIGFNGLPEVAGLAGLGMFAVGLVMLAYADLIEVVEFLNVLVNVLSYTRLAAVLLAKAGMAFVVNLLFFGAYSHNGEFHFLINEGPAGPRAEFGAEAVMFDGLIHMGIVGVLFGIVVFVLGHLLVLALGVTSAGLQAVRLEYVEFFGKFYEGGGKPYLPFGKEREYTSD